MLDISLWVTYLIIISACGIYIRNGAALYSSSRVKGAVIVNTLQAMCWSLIRSVAPFWDALPTFFAPLEVIALDNYYSYCFGCFWEIISECSSLKCTCMINGSPVCRHRSHDRVLYGLKFNNGVKRWLSVKSQCWTCIWYSVLATHRCRWHGVKLACGVLGKRNDKAASQKIAKLVHYCPGRGDNDQLSSCRSIQLDGNEANNTKA